MDKLKKNSKVDYTSILADSKFFNDKDMVPTDVPMINVALSGSVDGGLAPGLTVLAGPSKHFKTSFALIMAAAYLKKAKERFGSWTLAAAAYNAGSYGIAKRLETQQVTSYYDALLPDETERYVFRILALKEVISNPKKYGFVFDENDLYTLEKTKEIKVDSAITNIASFAKNFGLNYKELKKHNPWLRENHLNNKSKKNYLIKIPID